MTREDAVGGASENQRERQRLETRNRLFDLAIEEFQSRGVDKARIRDIVEKAGVVPGTFYFHFPTKEHVLLELGQRIIAKAAAALPGAAQGPPRLSSLLATLATAPQFAADELGDPELLRATISIFQRPPVDTDFEANPIQAALRDCLEAERQVGHIDSDLSSSELSQIILMAFFGTLVTAPDDPAVQAEQVRRTLGFFENALLRSNDRRTEK
jgi:AcrR family transcriptional regulator